MQVGALRNMIETLLKATGGRHSSLPSARISLLKARQMASQPSLLAEGKEECTSLLDDKFDKRNSRVELHDDIEGNVTRLRESRNVTRDDRVT
jgi:hypothetical protein